MSVRWHSIGQIRWDLLNAQGQVLVGTEASLRDGLALRAFCSGWDVATEVDLGAWGRIDVLATNGQQTLVIEAKLEARTARQIRSACNQVNGYASQVEGVPGYRRPLVVANQLDSELAEQMTSSVPVEVVSPSTMIYYLGLHGDIGRASYRLHEFGYVKANWSNWVDTMPQPDPPLVGPDVLDEFPDAETLGDLTRDKRS